MMFHRLHHTHGEPPSPNPIPDTPLGSPPIDSSATPTSAPGEGGVSAASSGLVMLAGGAAAMLLIMVASAVIHMWRRQCRLEEALRESRSKLQAHQSSIAARDIASRISRKVSESLARMGGPSTWASRSMSVSSSGGLIPNPVAPPPRVRTNPDNEGGCLEAQTPPSAQQATPPSQPHYVPGTHSDHASLVTTTSINQACDDSKLATSSGTAPVSTSGSETPRINPPHLRRLGSTVFNSRSNGPQFELSDARTVSGSPLNTNSTGPSVNAVSGQPESYTSGECDFGACMSPMHTIQSPSRHSSQDPYTAAGPVVTGPGTGRKGGAWSWGRRMRYEHDGDAAVSDCTMVPVSEDPSKFRTSFQPSNLPTEASIAMTDAGAYHRISQMTQMTQDITSTELESRLSVTNLKSNFMQSSTVELDVKGAARAVRAMVAQHAQQDLRLQLTSAGTVTTSGGDSIRWPSGDSLRCSRKDSSNSRENGQGSEFSTPISDSKLLDIACMPMQPAAVPQPTIVALSAATTNSDAPDLAKTSIDQKPNELKTIQQKTPMSPLSPQRNTSITSTGSSALQVCSTRTSAEKDLRTPRKPHAPNEASFAAKSASSATQSLLQTEETVRLKELYASELSPTTSGGTITTFGGRVGRRVERRLKGELLKGPKSPKSPKQGKTPKGGDKSVSGKEEQQQPTAKDPSKDLAKPGASTLSWQQSTPRHIVKDSASLDLSPRASAQQSSSNDADTTISASTARALIAAVATPTAAEPTVANTAKPTLTVPVASESTRNTEATTLSTDLHTAKTVLPSPAFSSCESEGCQHTNSHPPTNIHYSKTRQSLTDMHDFGMHSIDGSAAESDARSHASSYAPVVSLSGAGIGDTPVATTPDACVSSLGSNSSGKESACENSGSITFRAAQNDVTHQGGDSLTHAQRLYGAPERTPSGRRPPEATDSTVTAAMTSSPAQNVVKTPESSRSHTQKGGDNVFVPADDVMGRTLEATKATCQIDPPVATSESSTQKLTQPLSTAKNLPSTPQPPPLRARSVWRNPFRSRSSTPQRTPHPNPTTTLPFMRSRTPSPAPSSTPTTPRASRSKPPHAPTLQEGSSESKSARTNENVATSITQPHAAPQAPPSWNPQRPHVRKLSPEVRVANPTTTAPHRGPQGPTTPTTRTPKDAIKPLGRTGSAHTPRKSTFSKSTPLPSSPRASAAARDLNAAMMKSFSTEEFMSSPLPGPPHGFLDSTFDLRETNGDAGYECAGAYPPVGALGSTMSFSAAANSSRLKPAPVADAPTGQAPVAGGAAPSADTAAGAAAAASAPPRDAPARNPSTSSPARTSSTYAQKSASLHPVGPGAASAASPSAPSQPTPTATPPTATTRPPSFLVTSENPSCMELDGTRTPSSEQDRPASRYPKFAPPSDSDCDTTCSSARILGTSNSPLTPQKPVLVTPKKLPRNIKPPSPRPAVKASNDVNQVHPLQQVSRSSHCESPHYRSSDRSTSSTCKDTADLKHNAVLSKPQEDLGGQKSDVTSVLSCESQLLGQPSQRSHQGSQLSSQQGGSSFAAQSSIWSLQDPMPQRVSSLSEMFGDSGEGDKLVETNEMSRVPSLRERFSAKLVEKGKQ